ncbi:MAG: enoyl-CoA hydratase/isomerase family protein [Myxococcota bacterium]
MSELVETSVTRKVATVRFNHPRRLNGWTLAMQDALRDAFEELAARDDVSVVVVTGTGDYYSAGVDLGGSLKIDHPKTLRSMIVSRNHALFELFIQFPKPLIAAVNGHAIGAPVTSATLCDTLLASTSATFSTPFAKVGLPAEGCSSVQFPKLLGAESAQRMLGPEGWKPTAQEALEIGLANEVLEPDELLSRAQTLGEQWANEGRTRVYRGETTRDSLEDTNAQESERVADAFLSSDFLMGQYRFMRSRKKTVPAFTFLALRLTRPAWALLL